MYVKYIRNVFCVYVFFSVLRSLSKKTKTMKDCRGCFLSFWNITFSSTCSVIGVCL